MADFREQRYAIKFCVKLEKSATDTYSDLKKAYGIDAMSERTCFRWHKDFKDGRESCELEGGPGAPVSALTEETINTGGVMIRTDPHLTIRQLAIMLDISIGSVHTLMHDHLNVSRVCARWIPRLLTPVQKQNRVDICQLWLQCVRQEGDAWWKNIITADESWIYCYDPATKQQSTEWVEKGGPTPKKPRAQKSAAKAMVITFFDYRGMVYTHTVPQGQTINGVYYISVLRQLIKDHIPKKRPDLVGRWKLHHDNARPHVANAVLQFLAKKGIETVPHPPYSPDLAPNDFFLYPQAKKELKGRRFPTAAAAVKKLEAILKVLSKEGFEHVFKEWQRRWNKCVALNGDYLEGDTSVKV